MKIQRKRETKKIKITHNRGLFYLILVLLVILIAVIVILIKTPESIQNNNMTICAQDNDCVKVQTTLCPCSASGEEKCVLSSEVNDYQIDDKKAKDIVCAEVYNCKIKSCSCIEGTCVGVEE